MPHTHEIPPHGHDVVPWKQSGRSGTREDRTLSEVTVSLPPAIADLDVILPPDVIAMAEQALIQIVRTDAEFGSGLKVLNSFLIRTESVASSKLEYIEASSVDYVRAIAGSKANPSALSMIAASAALTRLVDDVSQTRRISLASILAAHHDLMKEDSLDGPYAGKWREVQNWINGSDHSPRNADYVPPPAHTVGSYMADLEAFANRDDVPALVQAALVHAQFESIHPFTDGNGRIGRALINAVLRRRGITLHSVVPIASALTARRDDYFAALNHFHDGLISPLVTLFAQGCNTASLEAAETARRLIHLPVQWHELSRNRVGSTALEIIDVLLEHPTLNVETTQRLTATSHVSANAALEKLTRDGILQEITGRSRDRVWASPDVLAELDDLDFRIAQASTPSFVTFNGRRLES
ncbi:Fic family protein [Aurantimicrobium minutum]|uniref:Fic family protein n=1 Tax=Aurantimicrobium minutum TaxID=708131 RepID=UPI002477249B|nr:Fic family protein [Aurantimicrobium minutum]MDH6537149.1 Fic family protein [Aurantimicrobium minutum]